MNELVTAFMSRQTKAVVNGIEFTGLPLMEKTGNDRKDEKTAKRLAEEQLNILYS